MTEKNSREEREMESYENHYEYTSAAFQETNE